MPIANTATATATATSHLETIRRFIAARCGGGTLIVSRTDAYRRASCALCCARLLHHLDLFYPRLLGGTDNWDALFEWRDGLRWFGNSDFFLQRIFLGGNGARAIPV